MFTPISGRSRNACFSAFDSRARSQGKTPPPFERENTTGRPEKNVRQRNKTPEFEHAPFVAESVYSCGGESLFSGGGGTRPGRRRQCEPDEISYVSRNEQNNNNKNDYLLSGCEQRGRVPGARTNAYCRATIVGFPVVPTTPFRGAWVANSTAGRKGFRRRGGTGDYRVP